MQHIGFKHYFDIEEARKTNILLSGTNQVGKTLTACLLASILRQYGWNALTFDNSGVWKEKSDIPHYYQVANLRQARIPINRNIVYDISLLTISKQRAFVNQVLQYFWVSTVNLPRKPKQMFILEEFQLYGKNVRGEIAENIFRIMTVGANQGMRVTAITPDLALIDSAFIRLCKQRYHFKMLPEENSLRKFRRTYKSDWCRIVQDLDVGYCMYWKSGKAKVVKIPLFQRLNKPKPITYHKKKKGLLVQLAEMFLGKTEEQDNWEKEDDELTEETLTMFDSWI